MKSILKDSIPSDLYQTNVVLYGAGITGKRILNLLRPYHIKIKYIIDDDPNKWGDRLENIEVVSFQQFEKTCLSTDYISVILTTIYGKSVLKRLDRFTNLEVYEMYSWLDEMYELNFLIKGLDDKYEIEKFCKESSLIKNKLADAESQRVLDGLYEYMNFKDLNAISDICTEHEQYFIPEVLAAIHEPLDIVDGGAYMGELYQTIRKLDIELNHWYCFEADVNNYKQLLIQAEKMGLAGIQVCIKKGLWDKEGILYFESEKGTASKIVDYKTSDQIETISLDTYFEYKHCNFIKMDIEGAEYSALCGAMKIIKRDRPILAISIYHSVEDCYRIPAYLMFELQGYRFYIRHHALIFCETVLYAIPD